MGKRISIEWRALALLVILATPVEVLADDLVEEIVEIQENAAAPERDSIVDQLIFQEVRRRMPVQRGTLAAAGRAHIESQLKATLDELAQTCQLNDAQRKKLELGGHGDVKRYFDQVEQLRTQLPPGQLDDNRLQELWPKIQPLQEQFSKGLFGEDSLFARTLRKTLTPEQLVQYQSLVANRRRIAYRNAIDMSLLGLRNDRKEQLLRPEQCEALKKLLLAETAPPLVFGPRDRKVVMLRLSQLPENKLKDVLDKRQWKQLQPQLLDASGTEDLLVQAGIIDEQKPVAPVILRSRRTVVEAKFD